MEGNYFCPKQTLYITKTLRNKEKQKQRIQTMPRSKVNFVLLLLLHLHALHFSSANQPIQAIVVLVLENRSFDHMLGWLKKDNPGGYPSVDGLTGKECNRHSTTDPKSPAICVSDDAQYVDPDPGHSFEASSVNTICS